jgi:hypothetical protein
MATPGLPPISNGEHREVAVYSWIIGRIVKLLYGKVSQGRLRLPLLGLADDATLFCPGTSSFGGEHRGKTAIRGPGCSISLH